MWLVLERDELPGSFLVAVVLSEGASVIGSGAGSLVALPDDGLDLKQVRIERRGETVTFSEVGVPGKVTLDGVRASTGTLAPGSRLGVGRSVLRLVRTPPPPSSVPSATPTDWLPFADFLETLHHAGHPRMLLERLLQGLVKLWNAERGFVLLRDVEGEELVPVASHQLKDAQSFLAVSSTVYRRALQSRSLVHIPNTEDDKDLGSSSSLAISITPLAILCAPLAAGGDPFGVIYLDRPAVSTFSPQQAVGADQLRLLEVVVGLASQLVAASRVRAGLLSARGRLKALTALSMEGERFILGEGEGGRLLREQVEATAAQDVSVLVTGETGTGKEMVARAIHILSPRREEPFVPVNCAALPPDLAEAELFGVERGAFTGAAERRLGRFELAGAGTLFLDEVGDLPSDVQAKLLRVLQERRLTRLGGTGSLPLGFRLICATNRDLEGAVAAGTFRRDLYYRINVFRIELKPLRDRPEDIIPLARHFLQSLAARQGRKLTGFTEAVERLLRSHPWPGNVRELRNAVERAVVVERGSQVDVPSLPIRPTGGGGSLPAGADLEALYWATLPPDYEQARELFEETFIRRSLEYHGGNISAAAKATGLPRSTIYRRMARLGMTADKGRESAGDATGDGDGRSGS